MTIQLWSLWFWIFSNILDKHVFWSVDISAELEIVDFSDISFVEIFSQEKLEKWFFRRNETQFFKNTSELFSCDMATACSIIVLELRLDKNSLVSNLSLNCTEKIL